MSKDDFTFKVNENRLLRARFRFLEKKKGNWHVGGRLHLPILQKKNSTDLLLQI